MKRLPIALFLLALAMRVLLVAVTQLDGLYGQDAFAYLGCAHEITHLRAAQIPCADFHWPLGYPALAALFLLLAHADPFGAQLASIVAGAAVAPLAYWLAVETVRADATPTASGRTGLVAGLIVTFCSALMLSSIVVMSDAAGLMWATLSACLLLRWGRTDSEASSVSWLASAAAALALAIVTRWIFAGLLVPFVVFLTVTVVRRVHRSRYRYNAASSRFATGTRGEIGVAAAVFLLILGAQLFLNVHSPAPVLKHSWVVTWSPLNAWRVSFDNPDGHFDYRIPPVIFYAEPLVHPFYLSPLLTGCVLLGTWQLRRSAALLVVGGWMVALYLYLIGIPYENGRFGLAYFTPVAVLAAIGMARVPVPSWLRRAGNARKPADASGVPPERGGWRWRGLLLAVSLAMSALFTVRAAAKLHSVVALQDSAIRYLQSQIPRDATVVTFELSIALEYYTPFRVVDLFAQSPQTLRPIVCGEPTVYVYVQGQDFETQWLGKSPAENFHWLRERIGLQKLGTHGAWTLYRALPCSP
jgi:4-amino-4-deoxy-L-arabinose transferase-like glycosyltransferase